MKRPLAVDFLVIVILIGAGAVTRLAFQDLPNFAPIAALAMFAGYFFRDWRWAACVPVGAMLVSDFFLASHSWIMMVTVYGSLCLPILWRGQLRRWLKLESPTVSQFLGSAAILFGGSFLGSCLFFTITNGMEWVLDCFRDSRTYEPTLAGLLYCYEQGIPFFQYTLLGDLCFGAVFFGGYAAAINLGLLDETEPTAQQDLA
jgi:hypothetical protein